jgi:glycosyltransferase involved in cell wall biosynthesis
MKSGSIKLFADAHVFDGRFQGTRTFIKGIYSALAGNNNVKLFLGAYNINNLEKNFPGANISYIKYRTTSGLFRLGYDIPSIIRHNKIDYAHFQYICPVIKNCRFIVTTHDVIFSEYPHQFSKDYRIKKNLLYKISAKKADILTTVSDYSKNSIEKYLDIKGEKIEVIPNGIDEIFFQPYDKKVARDNLMRKYGIDQFILYVSRFEPRKNHLSLLKIYIDLKLYERGYYLVLLGSRTMAIPEFDRFLDQLPYEIKRFIFIHDEIDDSDLLFFYQAAKLFVYPSKAEGFGIPPLEAAALKIPVICSNVSALAEYDFFGENHIDPSDYEILKQRLLLMLNHPSDDDSLEKISTTVKKRYSWKASAEKLYSLIERDKYLTLDS